MSKFEELYDKLLTDADYRQRLFDNPSAALTSIGIQPTPELLEAVHGIIHGVQEAGRILEPQGESGGGRHHKMNHKPCIT